MCVRRTYCSAEVPTLYCAATVRTRVSISGSSRGGDFPLLLVACCCRSSGCRWTMAGFRCWLVVAVVVSASLGRRTTAGAGPGARHGHTRRPRQSLRVETMRHRVTITVRSLNKTQEFMYSPRSKMCVWCMRTYS